MKKIDIEKLKLKNISLDGLKIHPVSSAQAKKLRTRVIAGAVAVAASASLLVSAAFDSPAEIVQQADNAPVAPIVQMVDEFSADDDDDGGVQDEEEEKRRGGIGRRLRELLLRLPVGVRACVLAPLWAIGSGITGLWTMLCSIEALPPVIASIVRILLTAAVILGSAAATVKTVMPDLPLRKVFTLKNLLITACAACFSEAALKAISIFVPEGDRIAELVHSLMTLAVLLAAAVPVTIKAAKKTKLLNNE